MDRTNVLECGCYAAAIPDPGVMRWLRWPNTMGGLVMWHEDDAGPLEERGYVTIDGVKGTIRRDEARCPHIFNVWFGGGWQKSHPGPVADPSYGR